MSIVWKGFEVKEGLSLLKWVNTLCTVLFELQISSESKDDKIFRNFFWLLIFQKTWLKEENKTI